MDPFRILVAVGVLGALADAGMSLDAFASASQARDLAGKAGLVGLGSFSPRLAFARGADRRLVPRAWPF